MTDSRKTVRGKASSASGLSRRHALVCLAAMGASCMLSPLAILAADDPLIAAQNLLNAGKAVEAQARLSRIIAADPRNERAYILLGRAYARSERPAEALAAFRTALRLNPSDTYTRMLVDILAQKPLPERSSPRPDGQGGRRAVSRLEKRAAAEREAFVSGKGVPSRGSGPFRLVLDPGHGGPDPGGVGRMGLREKDVALEMALETARRIQAQGPDVAVFLTRLSDVPLSEAARAACADLYGADLFVSLHAPGVVDAGVSGWYFFTSGEGLAGVPPDVAAAGRATRDFENRAWRMVAGFPLAGGAGVEQGLVRAAVSGRLRERSRDFAFFLRERMGKGPFSGPGGVGPADLSLLRAVEAPSIFVAAGFVSHGPDETVLADGARRMEMAGTLAEALCHAVRTIGR